MKLWTIIFDKEWTQIFISQSFYVYNESLS